MFKGYLLCIPKTSEIGCCCDIQDRLRNHALKGRSMELHNIGIALSGGGIRATIFHLGLFKWLAENGLLEEVKRVSSVSGASLCVGLIYTHNVLLDGHVKPLCDHLFYLLFSKIFRQTCIFKRTVYGFVKNFLIHLRCKFLVYFKSVRSSC